MVAVADSDADSVGLLVPETEADSVADPVAETEADSVADLVGLLVDDTEADGEELWDGDAVGLWDSLAVGVPVGVGSVLEPEKTSDGLKNPLSRKLELSSKSLVARNPSLDSKPTVSVKVLVASNVADGAVTPSQ